LNNGEFSIPQGKEEEESLPPFVVGVGFLQTYNPGIFTDLGLLLDLEEKELVVPDGAIHRKEFFYG
jgi:hypothetical protein